MSDNDNVIRFPKRPPSNAALEMYRQVTRNWSDHLKQLILPEHYQADQQKDPKEKS